MKKLLTAVTIFALTLGANSVAYSKTIKMGIILGFTGPIESLTPAMAASAELAFKEASDSGSLLNGSKIEVVRADSTCVDSAAATAAAEGVISFLEKRNPSFKNLVSKDIPNVFPWDESQFRKED